MINKTPTKESDITQTLQKERTEHFYEILTQNEIDSKIDDAIQGLKDTREVSKIADSLP